MKQILQSSSESLSLFLQTKNFFGETQKEENGSWLIKLISYLTVSLSHLIGTNIMAKLAKTVASETSPAQDALANKNKINNIVQELSTLNTKQMGTVMSEYIVSLFDPIIDSEDDRVNMHGQPNAYHNMTFCYATNKMFNVMNQLDVLAVRAFNKTANETASIDRHDEGTITNKEQSLLERELKQKYLAKSAMVELADIFRDAYTKLTNGDSFDHDTYQSYSPSATKGNAKGVDRLTALKAKLKG